MYEFLLPTHNLLRGIIVLLYLWAIFASISGWLKKLEWQENSDKPFFYLSMTLSVQLVLGLLLYIFFSPITTTAFQDFGAAMQNNGTRFFLVEHLLYMVLAVGLSHAGRSAGKKNDEAESKFKKAAVFTILSLVTLLLGMPWARPWLPWL